MPSVLVLLDRGIIDGLLEVWFPAVLLLASDALVGEKIELELFGIAEGRDGSVTSEGREVDASSNSDFRARFAGLVFSRRSVLAGIDLKGLAEAGLPGKGGGIRPGVPLPAVRGLSGSSRPALELLLFNDWVVGLAKPGLALNEDGWLAIESIFLNWAMCTSLNLPALALGWAILLPEALMPPNMRSASPSF